LREQFIELKKNMAEYIESYKVKRERGWGGIYGSIVISRREEMITGLATCYGRVATRV
jgi:hypothetical protein